MRTKVSEPTNGSDMILNARPANGSSSDAWRTIDLVGAHLDAVDRGDVGRRRQVVDDRVEQRLHALVLERRAAQHRHEGAADGALADAALQRLGIRLLAAEIGFERVVVLLDRELDQLRWRAASAALPSSRRGCRRRRTRRPSVSSRQMIAFISTRSTTPTKSLSTPIGSCVTSAIAPSRSLICVDAARRNRRRCGPSC